MTLHLATLERGELATVKPLKLSFGLSSFKAFINVEKAVHLLTKLVIRSLYRVVHLVR